MTGKEEVPDGASTAGAARPANIKAQRMMARGSTGVMASEMESRRRYYGKRIVDLRKEERRRREREREKSTCCTVR